MTKSVLVCLAPGSEEMEAVTTIDLLVRAGDIEVTVASIAEEGNLEILCSRNVKLLANTHLINVINQKFNAIVLPGGVKGAEYFRDSPLLIEKIRQTHREGHIVAAICATPAIVLLHHQLFPVGNMTAYPTFKHCFPANQWVDKRVCYDERVKLLTSQGPATAIDFALKLIDLLCGTKIAAEVANQLVLPSGIYNYQPSEYRSE